MITSATAASGPCASSADAGAGAGSGGSSATSSHVALDTTSYPFQPATTDGPLSRVFKPQALQTYGAGVLRGVSALLYSAQEDLENQRQKLVAGSDDVHMGRFMACHNQLRRYYELLLPSGDPSRFFRRYCLRVAVLCYFHVWQALDRQAKSLISDHEQRKHALAELSGDDLR